MNKESTSNDTKETVPFSFNIEKELLDRVKELASKDYRSISKEISYLINRGIQADESKE